MGHILLQIWPTTPYTNASPNKWEDKYINKCKCVDKYTLHICQYIDIYKYINICNFFKEVFIYYLLLIFSTTFISYCQIHLFNVTLIT